MTWTSSASLCIRIAPFGICEAWQTGDCLASGAPDWPAATYPADLGASRSGDVVGVLTLDRLVPRKMSDAAARYVGFRQLWQGNQCPSRGEIESVRVGVGGLVLGIERRHAERDLGEPIDTGERRPMCVGESRLDPGTD